MSEGLAVNNDEGLTQEQKEPATKPDPEKSADPKEASEKSSKSSTSSTGKQKNPAKVDILLKHAGDAPIMSKRKWTVDRTKKISWVADFIKKYIKSESSESLFLYVNQSFAPAPDTDLGSIFDCFGSDGKLVLHYCRTQAWG